MIMNWIKIANARADDVNGVFFHNDARTTTIRQKKKTLQLFVIVITVIMANNSNNVLQVYYCDLLLRAPLKNFIFCVRRTTSCGFRLH